MAVLAVEVAVFLPLKHQQLVDLEQLIKDFLVGLVRLRSTIEAVAVVVRLHLEIMATPERTLVRVGMVWRRPLLEHQSLAQVAAAEEKSWLVALLPLLAQVVAELVDLTRHKQQQDNKIPAAVAVVVVMSLETQAYLLPREVREW
jgi:hypothetical protein